MTTKSQPPSNFSGTARLFPLPNLVLYPAVVTALHIFEPRYRQLTADALASDGVIAMALLQPGWEGAYEGQPPIFPVVCLGKITGEERLPDGRYNLQLRGLSRARVVQEIENAKLYRSARVELLAETAVTGPGTEAELRRELLRLAPAWFPQGDVAKSVFRKLILGKMPLGVVCDVIAYGSPLRPEFKQELLEQTDVERRVRHLLHHLETNSPPEQLAAPQDRGFPPEFSEN